LDVLVLFLIIAFIKWDDEEKSLLNKENP